MRRAAAALLLLFSACAPARGPAASPSGPDVASEAEQGDITGPSTGAMTLCVANQSAGLGTIRVWVEDFRALTVNSGRRECKPVRQVSTGTRLYAESMGGGLRGPVKYRGQISRMDVPCWEWVLRDSNTSQIRLVPCGFEKRSER